MSNVDDSSEGYEEECDDEQEGEEMNFLEEEEDEEMSGDIPPSRQKKIMRLLENDRPNLVEGDLWYLIDIEWYRNWKKYVKPIEPGPISNGGLLDQSGENKVLRNLIEHRHYAIISDKEWEYLHSWFLFYIYFRSSTNSLK